MKDGIHPKYFKDVEVNCICGATFKINSSVPGPIKLETCYKCHPAYNKNQVIKKAAKGRMEKFLEKQKKIETMQK